MRRIKGILSILLMVVLAASFVGCGNKTETNSLKGEVKIDGSSTVAPLTEAVAEEFNKVYRDVHVTVGISGTGGGFKKFDKGETDINNASRKVKDQEVSDAKNNGIDMTEFKIAYDGISVVANKENTWVTDITADELKKIWEKGSTVKYWSDVRADWPKEEIKLYGPGTDSGTFEYFTEAINGEAGNIRADYSASVDPNSLVQGIAGDKYALGFFGMVYYEENADKLNLLKVNGVEPSLTTVMDGTYKPLSRPLYFYVANKSLEREDVKTYVKFYLENVKDVATDVGYFPLNDSEYEEGLNKLK